MDTVSPYVAGTIVLRTLGSGAYGRVVLARDPLSQGPERNVDVALKVSKNTTRQHVLWEAALLRKVSHAHVIKLLAVRASTPPGVEDPSELPILVFPPADTDLGTFLDRSPAGVPPTMLARRLMSHLAAALAHVHSHGIIHRDVKPANCLIFLAAEVHGELLAPNLVLADFGMARRESAQPRWCLDALPEVKHSPMTTMVCTAWYRPPELWAFTMDDHDLDQEIQEAVPYGCSLDVWSFGAVLYEVLSGESLVRRARNGAAMVQAVTHVIGACPAQGPGEELDGAPGEHWRAWTAAAQPGPRRPLPEAGAEWDLVRACLRWSPSARGTMATARQCAWFAEPPTPQSGVYADGSRLSQASADVSTLSEEACGDASMPSPGTWRKRVREWLESDGCPPRCRVEETTCNCKGHCRVFRHRKEGKCDCNELVIGTKYCITCKCSIANCDRPRCKSDYCYGHKNVIERAPLRVQLAVSASSASSKLLPCDLMHFLSTSLCLHGDVAMLILTAAIKEPLAVTAFVQAWQRLPARYSGSDLRSAILEALAAADGAPHPAELHQLHRQGTCRFFGLITTSSNLRIIRPQTKTKKSVPPRLAKGAAPPEQQTFRLGTNLTVYEVLDPSASICDKFLEATRAEEHFLATPSGAGASTLGALDDLDDYANRRAREALQRIGTKSGALPFSAQDSTGYCIDFLRRKLVMARLLQQNLHKRDWSSVSKDTLRRMSADAKGNLESIPDTYTASDISCFFTGRPDWGCFASVFPCLWGEVADKQSSADDSARALSLVKSEAFLRVVQSFWDTEGIPPHPAVAYKILLDKQSPRASTPPKKRKAGAHL